MAIINLILKEQRCYIEGELTRKSVPLISKSQLKQIFALETIEIDFSGLKRVDTAGLAWVCKIFEQANCRQKALQFINMPEQLIKLATLSGVKSFLPIK